MFEQSFGQTGFGKILIYSLTFGVFVGLAWLVHFFLRKVVKRITRKTTTLLDDAVVSALEKPIMLIIILVGVYLAIHSFSMEANLRRYASQGLGIMLSLLGIYTLVALLDAAIKWYLREVLVKKHEVGVASRLVSLFRVGVFIVALFVAALATLGILGISLAPITGWLGGHGWRIALMILLTVGSIVAVGEFVPKLVGSTLIRRAGESEEEISKRGATLSGVLVGTGQITVLFIAMFMLLLELQINIAPILAGFGVAGIAIGFGAQSLVKDIVTGIFIILENQYRVGDWVKIADIDGLVEDINLRRTVLRDFSGTVHVVPNGEIRVASNYTKELARVNMNVSVAYSEDIDHVISVINRVGKELAEDPEWAPSILTPPQALGVDKLGDSGIEIKILGETKPMQPWATMRELRLRLKKAFDKEGIEIPWPHTKVYFGNSPSIDDGLISIKRSKSD